jgi:hypothetical protein
MWVHVSYKATSLAPEQWLLCRAGEAGADFNWISAAHGGVGSSSPGPLSPEYCSIHSCRLKAQLRRFRAMVRHSLQRVGRVHARRGVTQPPLWAEDTSPRAGDHG